MAKYRIAITNVEYGCIDVEADSLDEAMEKVESFDGDYFVHKQPKYLMAIPLLVLLVVTN